MEELQPGMMDLRTGKVVEADYANWTTHPNNPSAKAAE
jgi:dihydropyrimidine dehydrogenase (NAD+) subunit PreA